MREATMAMLVYVALLSFSAAGADSVAASRESEGESGSKLVWLPRDDPYPPYLADPHRANFEFLASSVSDVDIPDSGNTRYVLKLGGRVGVVRRESRVLPGEGWQIGLEAGFVGEFDLDHSYDNIGWDGIYGLSFTSTLSSDLRLKLGTLHRSSHVGDEYAERTGHQRINYTRQEGVAGLSWYFAPAWRAYGEFGWAYDIRNEALQAPGRVQLGLEYQSAPRWWSGQLGWFAALDVSAMEERDWRADAALRAGYLFNADGRRWSLSVMHYRGRPTMGEFFQHTETFTGLSLMMAL